eukprot:404850-Rhodomonas_salina.1
MDEGDNPGQELGQALTNTAMATAAGMGDKLSDGEGEKSPGKDQVTGRDGLDSEDDHEEEAAAAGQEGTEVAFTRQIATRTRRNARRSVITGDHHNGSGTT